MFFYIFSNSIELFLKKIDTFLLKTIVINLKITLEMKKLEQGSKDKF